MLSKPLFKQSVKSNWVMWTAITAVMSVLCAQFSALSMTQSMIFTMFYGMMATILPSIYVLVTANKLIASQVDRGSMAYVLSTPIKRSTVVFTQMIFLVSSIAAMFGVQMLIHLGINAVKPIALSKAMGGTPQYSGLIGDLTGSMIFKVNLSAMVVCIAIAAVCFMFSGIFNSSKYSMGISGTFVGVMILGNMLAMFGDLGVKGLDKFRYLTICSFYDYESVIFRTNDWMQKLVYPALIALGAFAVCTAVFRKKDLPL